MAKVAVKRVRSSSALTSVTDAHRVKLTQKQKKKKFWKKHPKKAIKEKEEKPPPLVPPRAPEHFSSNWKALQELLKPDVRTSAPSSSSSSSSSSSNIPSKEQKVSDKKPVVKTPKRGFAETNGEAKESSLGKERKKSPKEEKEAEEQKRKRRKMSRERPGRPEAPDQSKKVEEDHILQAPKVDIWFDDVDPDDIEAAMGPEAGQIAREMQGIQEKKSTSVEVVLVKERAFEGLTKTVAMDCEMVGVGLEGEDSILARVSIVNQFGKCVYDKYVKPTERVTDYRTAVSGIRHKDIKNGELFQVVQQEVSEILRGRVLVGHAVHNDLKILLLDHPKKAIRDTQRYKPFKQIVKCARPSLKLLCENILSVKVQTGEHCSIQDAQAAMRLYTMEKKHWEAAIKAKYSKPDPSKDTQEGAQ